MNRTCQHCGDPIPPNKRSDSNYCSDRCRKYASKKRKESGTIKNRKAGKPSLSGLPVSPLVQPEISRKEPEKIVPPLPPVPDKEQELTYEMMPPLRGYVEDAAKVNLAKLPPPPEPPAVFSEAPLPAIEPQYQQYNVSVPNPEYNRRNDLRAHQLNLIKKQSDLVTRHEQTLQKVKEATNLSALQYLGFGAGGATVGYQMAGSDNKLTGAFVGAAFGLLLGRIFDWMTAEQFAKEKAAAITKQAQLVKASRFYLSEYAQKLTVIENALRQQSERLIEQRTKLLNGEDIVQHKRELQQQQERKTISDHAWEKHRDDVADYEARYGSIEEINAAFAEAGEMPEAEVNDSGVVSSLGLNKVVGGALLFKGPWRAFFGAPSRDFKLVIHGPSFSGKSHLTLQFAHYLALHHGTVLYNTSEEGFSRTMDAKLEKLGARAKGLDIGRYTTVDELKAKIPRTAYNFIVLDSVSDMNMSAEDLQELRRYYCCSAIIGVCQNTKAGEIRGGYDLVHDADIKIRVEDKIAYTDKNRFVDDQPQLEIFNIPPVPVTAKAEEQEHEGGKIIPLIPPVTPEKKQDGNSSHPANPGTPDKPKDEPGLWDDWNDLSHIV